MGNTNRIKAHVQDFQEHFHLVVGLITLAVKDWRGISNKAQGQTRFLNLIELLLCSFRWKKGKLISLFCCFFGLTACSTSMTSWPLALAPPSTKLRLLFIGKRSPSPEIKNRELIGTLRGTNRRSALHVFSQNALIIQPRGEDRRVKFHCNFVVKMKTLQRIIFEHLMLANSTKEDPPLNTWRRGKKGRRQKRFIQQCILYKNRK